MALSPAKTSRAAAVTAPEPPASPLCTTVSPLSSEICRTPVWTASVLAGSGAWLLHAESWPKAPSSSSMEPQSRSSGPASSPGPAPAGSVVGSSGAGPSSSSPARSPDGRSAPPFCIVALSPSEMDVTPVLAESSVRVKHVAAEAVHWGLNGRDVAVVAASNAGDLPLDALYEILLRLPAKALCRLRTVCRFWRSLLSDPRFAAAHAARARDRREPPLIISGFYSNASEAEGRHVPGSVANIMDLSGHIVKQVRMDGHRVMNMPLNLACVRSIADGTCRLLDPATYNTTDAAAAAAAAMRYYVGEDPIFCDNGIHLFGQVASTGEYKALRKVTRSHVGEYGFLYEVCTLSGGRPRWRAVQGPPDTFCQTRGTGVAIGGVVYLLIAAVSFAVTSKNPVVQRDWMYSFDLETEKWLPNIKGPPQQGFFFIDNPAVPPKFYCGVRFSLANLNGSLVIVHGPSPETNMDLWFLMDSEKSLWVKQYSIQLTMERLPGYFQPLVVLDDGRIVVITTCATGLQTLEIHDPRTKSFSTVAEMGRCCAFSVYTGNLLSLGGWQPTDNEKEEKEEVMHDSVERNQNVSKLGLVTGLCQINSFYGLVDAFLYVMTAWK